MADKKPAPAKPAAKGLGDALEGQIVLFLFLFILVLLVVAPSVLEFFGHDGNILGFIPNDLAERTAAAFSSFVDTVGFVSIFISLMLFMALIYAKVRLKEVVDAFEAGQKALENVGKPSAAGQAKAAAAFAGTGGVMVGNATLPGTEQGGQASDGMPHGAAFQPTNPKWLAIERQMASPNSAEWRVAILEADMLLYEMLDRMGYEGDSIGEMLKKVEPSDFATVQDAWKAHIIRNNIAHQAGYELTREEADRAIRLFKRVFDEFYFV